MEGNKWDEKEWRKGRPFQEARDAGRMVCGVCGDLSSALTCYRCSTKPPCPSCASLSTENERLKGDREDWIRWKDIATKRIALLEKVVEVAKQEVPDKCTCDEAYKSRGMTDHDCRYCDMVELRTALAALRGGGG